MLKRLLLSSILIAAGFFYTGCDETNNPVTANKGKVFITSTPSAAQIFVNGVNQSKVTPDTLSLDAGTYQITLKKSPFKDTTFSVTVTANQTITRAITMSEGGFVLVSTPSGAAIALDGSNTGFSTPARITLAGTATFQITLTKEGYMDTTFTVNPATVGDTLKITLTSALVTYGPVKIYESAAPSASQPSGLIFKTGEASSISSGNRLLVDVWYSTTGFVIASADQWSGLSRVTYMKVGESTNLTDGVASSAKDNSWVKSVADTQNNYIFAYDNDGNYTKFKIVGRGGGTSLADPAWVEIQLIYNKKVNDKGFGN